MSVDTIDKRDETCDDPHMSSTHTHPPRPRTAASDAVQQIHLANCGRPAAY